MRNRLLAASFCVAGFACGPAMAGTVSVLDEYGNAIGPLTSLYTGQGYTVNALTDSFTASSISGSNLVILTLFNSLSGSQLTALDNYVDAGGRLLMNSDGQGFENFQNSMNAVLTSLGSSIVNVDGAYDANWHTTTNIVADPFTAGVSSIYYAYTSALTGGTALVYG